MTLLNCLKQALRLCALAMCCAAAAADKSADTDFEALVTLARQLPPDDLPPSEHRPWSAANTARMRQTALEFYQDYPTDPRRWEAALTYYAMNLHNTPGTAAYQKQVRDLIDAALTDKTIDEKWWKKAKELQAQDVLMLAARMQNDFNVTVDMPGVRRPIDEFIARYPLDQKLVQLELRYTRLLKSHDQRAAEAWMALLARGENPFVAPVMAGQLRIADMRRKPPVMAFKALDGREVDLQKLRGKLVLIDFWATWCGPCVAEMPKIRKLYADYHDKGFEIIGISLDDASDRQALADFVKQENMPWVQHFDGKGWKNELAVKYGIQGVPAHLFLDRTGLMVMEDGGVEKLEEELRRRTAGD